MIVYSENTCICTPCWCPDIYHNISKIPQNPSISTPPEGVHEKSWKQCKHIYTSHVWLAHSLYGIARAIAHACHAGPSTYIMYTFCSIFPVMLHMQLIYIIPWFFISPKIRKIHGSAKFWRDLKKKLHNIIQKRIYHVTPRDVSYWFRW